MCSSKYSWMNSEALVADAGKCGAGAVVVVDAALVEPLGDVVQEVLLVEGHLVDPSVLEVAQISAAAVVAVAAAAYAAAVAASAGSSYAGGSGTWGHRTDQPCQGGLAACSC